ncbi:MAG: PDZ domain-containing protein [Terriglobia bacterium]
MRVEHTKKLIAWATLVLLVAVSGAAAQEGEKRSERSCSWGARRFDPVSVGVFVSSRGAWLGVSLTDVTPEKVSELKLTQEYGAVVSKVEEESPAAKVGLQEDDVILEYQGVRVESAATLARLVRETPPGRMVRLRISRDGRQQTLTATLERRRYVRGEIRIPPIRIPEIDIRGFSSRPRLGISADELTLQLAEYFGVKQGKGVLVREVNAGSPAEKAGLKAGDVIVRLDDKTIEDVGDLRRALRRKKGGESVTLGIVRNRAETLVRVELEETRRGSRDTPAYYFYDPDEFRGYQESMRTLQRRMSELQGRLQRELGEKQRELQKRLIRIREEIRHRVVI